eukprot:911609-Rhodomonas_salina.2
MKKSRNSIANRLMIACTTPTPTNSAPRGERHVVVSAGAAFFFKVFFVAVARALRFVAAACLIRLVWVQAANARGKYRERADERRDDRVQAWSQHARASAPGAAKQAKQRGLARAHPLLT